VLRREKKGNEAFEDSRMLLDKRAPLHANLCGPATWTVTADGQRTSGGCVTRMRVSPHLFCCCAAQSHVHTRCALRWWWESQRLASLLILQFSRRRARQPEAGEQHHAQGEPPSRHAAAHAAGRGGVGGSGCSCSGGAQCEFRGWCCRRSRGGISGWRRPSWRQRFAPPAPRSGVRHGRVQASCPEPSEREQRGHTS